MSSNIKWASVLGSVISGSILTTVYADNLNDSDRLIGKRANFPASLESYSAPQIMLAKNYQQESDVKSLLVSEKLDGVRAYWDGKQLKTRSGRLINVPDWFIEDFPSLVLDGELWIGRNQFEAVSGLVRTKIPDDKLWQQVTYQVFDAPKADEVFSQRYVFLKDLIGTSQSPYLRLVKQQRVADQSELMALLDKVVKAGGEGLILHHQKSIYTPGRSPQLLKLKRFNDAEARVIKHLPGQGKYQGMLGAIEVANENGQVFRIGSGFSDQERQSPPKIGSLITYRYRGKTKNDLPRFATFLRVREEE